MKPLFIAVFILFALAACAQEKIISVSSMKYNGSHATNKESADYFHVVSTPDSGSTLYNIAEYYKNGAKKLIGKGSAGEPTVYEGQCLTYYKSGRRESMTTYKNGLPVGDKYEFFPNGKLYCQKEYPDNNNRYNDIERNFLIKANYDSLGTALVSDGNGYYKGYDYKFNYIEEEGLVKNGKRNGVWKGVEKNINITYSENYKDGVLINGTSTDKDGVVANYTKQGTPPKFRGGLDAFDKYLSRRIVYPTENREITRQGLVVVGFVVEKDGKVTGVHIERSAAPSLDTEAMRVIQNSPRWEPAVQFGRKVRVEYTVPINFNPGGN